MTRCDAKMNISKVADSGTVNRLITPVVKLKSPSNASRLARGHEILVNARPH